MSYKKIIITGDAGRGKSTLAKKMEERLGILSHSTDDYFYEIKFSKTRDRQKSIEEISKLYEEEKWIVEGTTQHLLKPGLDKADVIIYLHYRNFIFQALNILIRSLKRNNELKGTLGLLKHSFYKKFGFYKNKVTQKEFVRSYKNKVIELTTFKEINNFVSSIK